MVWPHSTTNISFRLQPSTKDKWFNFLFGDSSDEERIEQLPYLNVVLPMKNVSNF